MVSELPGISRNAYSYEPKVSESKQMLMRRIDELYTGKCLVIYTTLL